MLPFRALVACLIATIPVIAQPPGGSGVTGAHIHVNSADPAAAVAFFKNVIGTASNDSADGVSTLGVTILFARKAPGGPSAGSVIDHVAFKVPDLQPLAERLSKTAYKSSHPQGDELRLMVDGPDGVRIELIEDNSMYAGLEFSHIHLQSAHATEMQAWYLKNFGGLPGAPENPDALQLPGAPLRFTQSDAAAPTAGRAIDHLAFEVKDLDGFCKKLTESGMKLDTPPHAAPELKASVALLTDQWGMRIELMESAAR